MKIGRLVVGLCLALSAVAVTNEALTKKSSEKMAHARLGDDVIVSLIQNHGLFGEILKPGADPAKQENTALGRFFSSQDQRIFSNGLRFVIIGKGHARRYAVQRMGAVGGEPVAAA